MAKDSAPNTHHNCKITKKHYQDCKADCGNENKSLEVLKISEKF